MYRDSKPMIFKQQTRPFEEDVPGKRGNCFAAVIASALEMEVEDVIQIQEYYDDDNWLSILDAWLEDRGYVLEDASEMLCFHDDMLPRVIKEDGFTGDLFEYVDMVKKKNMNEYYFVAGTSPRDKRIGHIVIYKNGKMVHDPHPDGTGITTFDSFMKLKRITS